MIYLFWQRVGGHRNILCNALIYIRFILFALFWSLVLLLLVYSNDAQSNSPFKFKPFFNPFWQLLFSFVHFFVSALFFAIVSHREMISAARLNNAQKFVKSRITILYVRTSYIVLFLSGFVWLCFYCQRHCHLSCCCLLLMFFECVWQYAANRVRVRQV